MSGAPLKAKLIQTKLRRFRANVVGATKDFLYVVPVLFPEGPDWQSLNATKIELEDVEVEMKPYYNFATLSGSDKGVVSGDYPVYMNFYTGNTAGETESRDMSKYILAGNYVLGSATTGVKARYGGKYYKTIFSKEVSKEDLEQWKEYIANKDNDSNTIDDYNLESGKILLQKGRVVICIRKDDFMLNADEVITEENPTGEEGTGSTGNGAILRHLAQKRGVKEVQEEAPRKKGRKVASGNPGSQNPPPQPVDDKVYCEDPIVIDDGDGKSHKELIIDLPFWIITTLHIKYWRAA